MSAHDINDVDVKLSKELDKESHQLFNELFKMASAAEMEDDMILSKNLKELAMYVYQKNKKEI